MRCFHRFGLFPAHRKCLVMRPGELLPGAQLGQDGLHVRSRTAHPFELGVLEFLLLERCPHLVIAEDAAIVALSRLVEFYAKVLDRRGLQLLGNALLCVARRLPDLEETLMRRIVDGIGIDARPRLRLRRKNVVDGFRRQVASPARTRNSMNSISSREMPYRAYSSSSDQRLLKSCRGTKV